VAVSVVVSVDKRVLIVAGGAGLLLYLLRFRALPRYKPGSSEQVRLFTDAARKVGLPAEWGASPALANILGRESDGWVGQPNYTYKTWRDKTTWPAIWAELRSGVRSTKSSATGLGQLLLENVDKYYPGGRAGIGDARAEAAGMLRYIQARYGTPENAWAKYGTLFAGY
jgi:hypothetical protein